ncbi:MAG: phage terminase large subunit family protein [Proteobacteria bacterium]|nr:phage terminase large subunit family protein [Pseudomonadota bacterium]
MIYNENFNAGLRPDPLLLVSQWADKYRVLSQISSSEPGRFRTSRTPYLKELMDCLSPSSDVEEVIFMKGAQIGGTEAGNNWVGFVIDQAPGPMLVVQPTVEMAKRWSKGRLAPLISDTPCLDGKVKDPRSRDSGNTVQSKEFPGGIVVITGANSAVGLRSMPVRYLFLDEEDAYPLDVNGEGDPISLAIRRTSTFARRKILKVSTPTIQGLSRIERDFDNSDQRFFWIPCPTCKEPQILKWIQIKYDNDDPKTTRYECEHCGYGIKNHQKTWMLERGEWRARNPEITKFAGFHLSSLYSPVGWFAWEDAVSSFLVAKKNDELLKVWVNTVLGETWVDKGEAPDWERLSERAEDYKIGEVPTGGLLLTAGADVQKDRIEVEIVAWGQDKQSWSVEYRIFYGDPARPELWKQLSDLLQETFIHASGVDLPRVGLPIMMLAIDSGYATQEVYNWVRKQPASRVMAIKGVSRSVAPLGSPTKVDVTCRGKKLRRGLRMWPVGVSILKSEFYHWLKLTRNEDETYPNGYCHFPKYNPEFFKQLTAEQLVTRMVKGYPKREWQKVRDRNEALDCRVYARSAAIALGVEHWSEQKWQKIIGNIGLKPTSGETIEAPIMEQPASQKRSSNYLANKSRKRKSRSGFMG